jgi:hypothetical protein
MTGSDEICVSAAPAIVEPVTAISVVRPAFVASLLFASLASCLCCQWPVSHTPSLVALTFRAFAYVSAAALAGAAGAWLYWAPAKSSSSVSLRDFILWCSAGWGWAPAIVLLLQQHSLWAVPLVVLSAAVLAGGLRCIAGAASTSQFTFQRSGEKELFAEFLHPIRWDWHASVISICIYSAFFALRNQAIVAACALAATGAFLFAWQLSNSSEAYKARAMRRLVAAMLVATLITTLVLLAGVRGQGYGQGNGVTNARGSGPGDTDSRPVEGPAVGANGYQSIILWQLPPKRKITAPLQSSTALLGVRISKPIAIPFDGSYWYFQPPQTGPDLHAHVAHGNTLDVNIHSTNLMPLKMEAHQNLATGIRISRCREISVVIENRDNRPGNIFVGMLLIDSASAGKMSLYLGQQPIRSSEPDHFRIKLLPLEETLRFPIPSLSAMRRFDQITLIVTPDRARLEIGAKVAIRQFEILPR